MSFGEFNKRVDKSLEVVRQVLASEGEACALVFVKNAAEILNPFKHKQGRVIKIIFQSGIVGLDVGNKVHIYERHYSNPRKRGRDCGHWASHKFPYQEALREIIKALVLMNNHEEDYILYALDGMEIPLN